MAKKQTSSRSGRVPLNELKRFLMLAGMLCILPVVALTARWLLYSGPAPRRVSTESAAREESKPEQPRKKLVAGRESRRGTVACRIETPAQTADFFVFVDGEPVRDEAGKLLLTPCEILLASGAHTVTVAKEKWQDATQSLRASEPQTLDFQPTYTPFAEPAGWLAAPYFKAQVGEPIELASLAGGDWTDPELAADGLTLWFAGSAKPGKGIYQATRLNRYDEFGAPQFISLSGGSEIPASPTATADQLTLAFAAPGKGRIWGLLRKSPQDAFDRKIPLAYSPRSSVVWPAAQISQDGKRLYWIEEHQKKTQNYLATREIIDEDFAQEFDKPRKSALPGEVPCLSRDELRQYTFDGRRLQRYSRANKAAEFETPEVVGEFSSLKYVVRPGARQFCVTDDEQWLYYAADPEQKSGGLSVVRLSDGPARGAVVRGKPVSTRAAIAEASTAETHAVASQKEMPAEPAVDPLTQPLPYAKFQETLLALLGKREFMQADNLVGAAQGNARFAQDQIVLGWDAEDVSRLRAFWEEVGQAVAKLKLNDSIRVGVQGEFVRYGDGVLVIRTKTKEIEKPLASMVGSDLIALADRVVEKTDPQAQLRSGVFLHYDTQGRSATAATRLAKAGEPGREFIERLSQRKLHLARQELKREKTQASLALLREILADAPKSVAAREAAEIRDQAYKSVQWEESGPRKWEQTPAGEYTAAPGRQVNSSLQSSRAYKAFELSLEWKAVGATGQGGIYFRYAGTGDLKTNAFKVQLANDSGVKADKFSTGALFNRAAPTLNKALPEGQWNTLTLRVEGESVQATINGAKVLQTTASNADIPLEGFIGLDGELGGISYRKILLLDLNN